MKISWWKRVLSYLFEFHIESCPSGINPHLHVSIRKGRYQLCTDRAIYSFEDLYVNFARAFRKIDFVHGPIKKVLILGFGLGSIPIILEKMFESDFSFVCVEIDPNVIDLSSRYALPKIQSPLQLIQADAMNYLMQTTEKFDLVIMDIFLSDEIPAKFDSPSFLTLVENTFHSDTIFLYNRLAEKTADIANTSRYFEKTFQHHFKSGTYIDVKGNWILVNDRRFLKQV